MQQTDSLQTGSSDSWWVWKDRGESKCQGEPDIQENEI